MQREGISKLKTKSADAKTEIKSEEGNVGLLLSKRMNLLPHFIGHIILAYLNSALVAPFLCLITVKRFFLCGS